MWFLSSDCILTDTVENGKTGRNVKKEEEPQVRVGFCLQTKDALRTSEPGVKALLENNVDNKLTHIEL